MSIYGRLARQCVSISLLTLILSVTVLFGQTSGNKGDIVGTVYDPSRAAVPGAKVIVTNPSTGFSRELTTDQSGTYRFLRLDAGPYVLTSSAPGFAGVRNFGLIEGSGPAAQRKLTLRTFDATGKEWWRHEILASELKF